MPDVPSVSMKSGGEKDETGLFGYSVSKFVCANEHDREIFVKKRHFRILLPYWRQFS